MGCLKLTYDHEPHFFLQGQEEKIDTAGLQVWVNRNATFEGVEIKVQTQGGPGDGRGSAESFSFGFAFFFGISGEWGTVHDETGASKRYYTISANFGLGLDIGFNKKEIIPTDGSRFRVDQYKGFGKNLSMGAFFTSESRGGNYPTQTLDPFDMGTNYKERSNSYSPFLGIPVGFGLGDVGVLYQMGKTDFYK
jgi:hypothetical protein